MDPFDEIKKAAEAGYFIPVIGPDVSALLDTGATAIDSSDAPSVRRTRPQTFRVAVAAHAAYQKRAWNELYHKDLRAAEAGDQDAVKSAARWESLIGHADALVKSYLPFAMGSFDLPPDLTSVRPALGDSSVALGFEVSLLAVAMTSIYAQGLAASPVPLQGGDSEPGVELCCDGNESHLKGYLDELFVRCIEAADSPNLPSGTLFAARVKGKLYRLLLECVGANRNFWTHMQPAFTAKHYGYITTAEAVTGVASFSNMVPRGLDLLCGIRRSHLAWLASLFRHVALADSGAHRTRSELAFALSLHTSGRLWPIRDVRLHQSGELCRTVGEACDCSAVEALIALLEEARAARDGYVASSIAGLVRLASGPARALGAPPMFAGEVQEVGGDQRMRAIILSTCMDLEAERALASEFGRYAVMLPVYEVATAEDGETIIPGWVAGVCEGSDRLVTWQDVLIRADSEAAAVDAVGSPLLIKLYGSPLHKLPSASSLGLGPDCRIEHRLIVGEHDILHFLDGVLPDVGGLRDDLFHADRVIGFIGLDATEWHDRAQYVGIAQMPGSEPERGAYAPMANESAAGGAEPVKGVRFVAFDDADEISRQAVERSGVNMHGDPGLASVLNRLKGVALALKTSKKGTE